MADVTGLLSWFINFRNPIEIWKNEPTFLLCEIVYLLMAAMTLKHGEIFNKILSAEGSLFCGPSELSFWTPVDVPWAAMLKTMSLKISKELKNLNAIEEIVRSENADLPLKQIYIYFSQKPMEQVGVTFPIFLALLTQLWFFNIQLWIMVAVTSFYGLPYVFMAWPLSVCPILYLTLTIFGMHSRLWFLLKRGFHYISSFSVSILFGIIKIRTSVCMKIAWIQIRNGHRIAMKLKRFILNPSCYTVDLPKVELSNSLRVLLTLSLFSAE